MSKNVNQEFSPEESIKFVGDFGYFEGRKYHSKDISMIADMRRAGIAGNNIQLSGRALEEFVMKCLQTSHYKVLGFPVQEVK